MLGLIHALRARFNPSSPPARVSRLLRGPDRQPIGTIDQVIPTVAGLEVRATLNTEGVDLLHLTGGPGEYSIAVPLGADPDGLIPLGPNEYITRSALAEAWLKAYGSDASLEAWQRRLLDGGVEVSPRVARPLLDAENRRASIERELHAADPRPDLERARALAEYSQTSRPGHDEQEFAWQAYVDAGGGDLSPWRAFQAGLRAVVDRLES